jgi:mannose-6-phosphate isomerase-like protein (cupin superfamily)
MYTKGGNEMTPQPKPKTVTLDLTAMEYLRVLGGPPESVTMRSGYVVLLPSNSVGKHSTDTYEEIVVVLDGEGEMLFNDGSILPLKPHVVAYCPPKTEHDVRNSGDKPLRYLYIVAKALDVP